MNPQEPIWPYSKLVSASNSPTPACPANGACPEVPGRCGADPPEPLLTVRQAAQHLGVSSTSIHNYISSHQLPAIRLGRAVRIQPTDLADFIAAHRLNGKDPCTT